ncbi:MAG: glycosyltransferase family 1 protein [Nitrospirae bacterium]|nr:MAG: glycosyltransferase family 1 protein [Nitrospirota bacterium]
MNEPVAVAHLITKLELGGAQQNTLFTVAHLDRSRFRPILIAGEPGLLDREASSLPGVAFHRVPSLVRPIKPLTDLLALLKLTWLLARLKPTIVHTHSSKAGILGRLAAKLAGVPIILHSIHGFGFTPAHRPVAQRFLVALERLAARVTTGFIAVSEANRRQGMALGIFAGDRCTVIRSGIDRELFQQTHVDRPAKRRELGLDPGRPVIGMVAPFKPQKAPLDFVRMAALVHGARSDAQFLLIGDGELRSAIEAEIKQRGLAGVVHLAGWRRDIPEVMRCLDVLALTSRWEGLPRVYLEALACGVPVVGTRVDGATEAIQEGVNGYLVEPGDVRSLAERVLALLNHPEEAARMGQAGRSLPAEFDIHEMVRQQEREYDRFLAAMRNGKSLSQTAAYGTSAKH